MGIICCSAPEDEDCNQGPPQLDTKSQKRKTTVRERMMMAGSAGHDAEFEPEESSSTDDESGVKLSDRERVQKVVKLTSHYIQDYEKIIE